MILARGCRWCCWYGGGIRFLAFKDEIEVHDVDLIHFLLAASVGVKIVVVDMAGCTFRLLVGCMGKDHDDVNWPRALFRSAAVIGGPVVELDGPVANVHGGILSWWDGCARGECNRLLGGIIGRYFKSSPLILFRNVFEGNVCKLNGMVVHSIFLGIKDPLTVLGCSAPKRRKFAFPWSLMLSQC